MIDIIALDFSTGGFSISCYLLRQSYTGTNLQAFTSPTQTEISSDSLDVEAIDTGGNWMYYQVNMSANFISSTSAGATIIPIGDVDFSQAIDTTNILNSPELAGATLEGASVGPLPNGTIEELNGLIRKTDANRLGLGYVAVDIGTRRAKLILTGGLFGDGQGVC